MLEAGMKAPGFELPDQDGTVHTLEEYKGKKVVLYFYPRDNTPGCTKQACGFGELYPQFLEKGAVVLGVVRTAWRHTRSLKRNTDFRLPFFRIQSYRASRLMMYGRKKICMGKRRWVLSALLI